MDKSIVLLDGGFTDKCVQNELGGRRLDYLRLSEKLAEGTDRTGPTTITVCRIRAIPPTPEERMRYAAMDKFIASLRVLPRFEVRHGRLQRIGGIYTQKGVDVQMAVDLLRLSFRGSIGQVIIVTGDSDLIPAISASRDEGILVKLFYSRQSTHASLIASVDEHYVLATHIGTTCFR